MSRLRTALLQAALLCLPIPFALAISAFWYFVLYRNGLHFHPELEVIATAAWAPVFGILYGMVAALALYTAWNDYQAMETATRKRDREAFLDLRDKRIPIPIYTIMFAFAASLLAVMMGLKYPDAANGLCCVSSTAYLLFLVFVAVKEMDDPCTGIWCIAGVPKEWLEVDLKK